MAPVPATRRAAGLNRPFLRAPLVACVHKPLLATLLCCGVLLSGCADTSGDDTTGGAATAAPLSATMTSTGPPPKPVVYSDTLHFLAAPDMTPALPQAGSDIETPTDTGGFGQGGGGRDEGPQSQWAYQVASNGTTQGATVHVWIKIVEQLVQGPNPNPTQPTCTWYVMLSVGSDSAGDVLCLGEPVGVIAPGTKELVFDFPASGTDLEANETVTVRFGRTVFSSSPNNAVYILSGTPDHDSRIVLPGLKEAVPEALAG